jgi:hypothetical protein
MYNILVTLDLKTLVKNGIVSTSILQKFVIYENYLNFVKSMSKSKAVEKTSIMYDGLSKSYIYNIIREMQQ